MTEIRPAWFRVQGPECRADRPHANECRSSLKITTSNISVFKK